MGAEGLSMNERMWLKSSRSGTSVNCVEVALSPAAAAVRDSKNRAAGHFTVPAATWGFFLQGLKSGRFDWSR